MQQFTVRLEHIYLFTIIVLFSQTWSIILLGQFIINILHDTGNFSGPKHHEIVIAKGSAIELLRPDDTGKMISIAETPMFCVVRSILAFRLAGKHNCLLYLLMPPMTISVCLIKQFIGCRRKQRLSSDWIGFRKNHYCRIWCAK